MCKIYEFKESDLEEIKIEMCRAPYFKGNDFKVQYFDDNKGVKYKRVFGKNGIHGEWKEMIKE